MISYDWLYLYNIALQGKKQKEESKEINSGVCSSCKKIDTPVKLRFNRTIICDLCYSYYSLLYLPTTLYIYIYI